MMWLPKKTAEAILPYINERVISKLQAVVVLQDPEKSAEGEPGLKATFWEHRARSCRGFSGLEKSSSLQTPQPRPRAPWLEGRIRAPSHREADLEGSTEKCCRP